MIQGDSGIGKSETALELIKRGHRLIADDRVDVYQQDELTVIGEPPKIFGTSDRDPRNRDHRCHESFWCQCCTWIDASPISCLFRSMGKR